MFKTLGLLAMASLMSVCVYSETLNADAMDVLKKVGETLCGDLPADQVTIIKECDGSLSGMFKMSFGSCLTQAMDIKVMEKPFPCYWNMPGNDKLKECLEKRREMAVKMNIDVEAMRAKMLNPYSECMKKVVTV